MLGVCHQQPHHHQQHDQQQQQRQSHHRNCRRHTSRRRLLKVALRRASFRATLFKQPIRILARKIMLVRFRPPLHQAESPGDQSQSLGLRSRSTCRMVPVDESTSSKTLPRGTAKYSSSMVRPSFRATCRHSSACERLLSRRVPVRVTFSVGGWAMAAITLPLSHQIPSRGLDIWVWSCG